MLVYTHNKQSEKMGKWQDGNTNTELEMILPAAIPRCLRGPSQDLAQGMGGFAFWAVQNEGPKSVVD